MKFIILFFTFFTFINQINGSNINETCVACTKWSNFIWNLTQNVNEELIQSMTNLCSSYSDLSEQQAQSFYNKSLHHLFGFLSQKWNKEKICYDIKACHNNSKDDIQELNNFIGDDNDCKFCIYLNTKIKDLLTGSPTEMELKVHFEDACHYLKNYENECINLVDKYLDTLFEFIKKNFVPEDICYSLHVCPKKRQLQNTNIPLLPPEIISILPVNMSLAIHGKVSNKHTCVLCKNIIKIIQRQLRDNATDEQIINVLNEICMIFPYKDQESCHQIVTNYTHQLIQTLSQDIDLEVACLLVGLCNGQSYKDYLNGNFFNRYLVKGNKLCTECELIAHFIQNEIYNYKNEEQIEEFIKNHVCNRMSFVLSTSDCKAFIDQYGPIIMQTIAQDVFNPDILCYKELNFCKSAKIHIISDSYDKCEICQNIIENLSNIQQSDLEINHIIENGCQHLPQTHQVECALLVKSFAPYFLDMLNRYDDPKKICESIDICLTPGKIHLLGGHKCTYGPSYWCHSVSHANACNAFKYCHQKLWKPNQK